MDISIKQPSMKGWECPKCGKVYAPYVSECSKCGQEEYTFGSPYTGDPLPNDYATISKSDANISDYRTNDI